MPNVLGDSENYVMANPMQTPAAIVPEWYLLPFYAILRSIPNKLLGVIAMFAAILILLLLPVTDVSRSRGMQFRPLSKLAFFGFIGNFLALMQLGAKHVESPFIEFGQISTCLYFLYFTAVMYGVTLVENTFVELRHKEKSISYTGVILQRSTLPLTEMLDVYPHFREFIEFTAETCKTQVRVTLIMDDINSVKEDLAAFMNSITFACSENPDVMAKIAAYNHYLQSQPNLDNIHIAYKGITVVNQVYYQYMYILQNFPEYLDANKLNMLEISKEIIDEGVRSTKGLMVEYLDANRRITRILNNHSPLMQEVGRLMEKNPFGNNR